MRVVIGDGDALSREGLAALLDRHGLRVLACVRTLDELSRAISRHRPELAVADAGVQPTGDGPPALASLRTLHPETGLLVLCTRPAVEQARALVATGVAGVGFLVRDRVAGAAGLLDAARAVAAGGWAVDPEIVARLLTPPRGALSALSERERDVLALLADGRTNAAIAARLWLTNRTVEGHVRSIFAKLRLLEHPDDHRRVLAARAYLAARDTC